MAKPSRERGSCTAYSCRTFLFVQILWSPWHIGAVRPGSGVKDAPAPAEGLRSVTTLSDGHFHQQRRLPKRGEEADEDGERSGAANKTPLLGELTLGGAFVQTRHTQVIDADSFPQNGGHAFDVHRDTKAANSMAKFGTSIAGDVTASGFVMPRKRRTPSTPAHPAEPRAVNLMQAAMPAASSESHDQTSSDKWPMIQGPMIHVELPGAMQAHTRVPQTGHQLGILELGSNATAGAGQAPGAGIADVADAAAIDSITPGRPMGMMPPILPGDFPPNETASKQTGTQPQVVPPVATLPRPTTLVGQLHEWLFALGGGTGARLGSRGLYLDRHLARSMRLQDEVVLFLLLFVYFATLSVSAKLAFRQSGNNSNVTFYADPRYHTAMVDGFDVESFLEAFNLSPKGTYLRVTGYTPTYQDAPGSMNWRGSSFHVDFSFSLDLSPWVMRGSLASSPVLDEGVRPDGVVVEDAFDLEKFLGLRERANHMAIVELRKTVTWANWEELATNIKHQIRQSGFDGVIAIDRTEEECMSIFKNTQWANFMHSKSLKVILALSVVGWIFYAPYVWLRCSRIPIRCLHRIDIEIGDYWPLIANHLSAQGFDANPSTAPRIAEDMSSTSDSTEGGQESRQ